MATIKQLTTRDAYTLKAVVLYILDKCGELDMLHLFKILYFADREHYAVWGRRIVKDTFCAFPKGPVPSQLYDAIKIVQGRREEPKESPLHIIADALEVPDMAIDYYLKAKERPDMDYLSKSDIEMLDKYISYCLPLSAAELSIRSHDLAWKEANDRRSASPIDVLKMAEAGGADSGEIEYLREMLEIDALLGVI